MLSSELVEDNQYTGVGNIKIQEKHIRLLFALGLDLNFVVAIVWELQRLCLVGNRVNISSILVETNLMPLS